MAKQLRNNLNKHLGKSHKSSGCYFLWEMSPCYRISAKGPAGRCQVLFTGRQVLPQSFQNHSHVGPGDSKRPPLTVVQKGGRRPHIPCGTCVLSFHTVLFFLFWGEGEEEGIHFLTRKMRRRMKTCGRLWRGLVSASSPSRSEPRAGPTAIVLLSPHGRISQMLNSSAYPLDTRWDPDTCWEVLLCPLSGGGQRDDGEVEALALTAAERKQRPCELEEPFLGLVVACQRRLVFYRGASRGVACLLGLVVACQTSLVGGGRPECWGLPSGSR